MEPWLHPSSGKTIRATSISSAASSTANEMGALRTDFTMVKPGALHRANGGYLVLDTRDLLLEPQAWESLKRSLKAGCLRIESLGQAYGLVSTTTLEPEPIPLDVKVVLVGERSLYYLLERHDPEFSNHFRVVGDFDEDLEWTVANQRLFARKLAAILERDELLPMDAEAVARVIEECARLAGGSARLCLSFRDRLQPSSRGRFPGEGGGPLSRAGRGHPSRPQEPGRALGEGSRTSAEDHRGGDRPRGLRGQRRRPDQRALGPLAS